MPTKVLITGASGLLGANLVRFMCQQGFQVNILVRAHADISVLSDLPIHVIYGCIDHQATVESAIQDCDYVVHAASLTVQWGASYEDYKRINITATQYIAEACLKHNVKKLIYISTANTLAPGSKEVPGTELNAFGLHHINSGYINSKYVALQYIQEQVQLKGLPAVIVSPTFMIGKYDIKPSSGQLIMHGLKKSLLVYPTGGKNFVHVEDVCKGVVQALDKGLIGEHYLLAGHNLSYKEFYNILYKQVGRSQKGFQIPGIILRIAGRIGSVYQMISKKSVKLNYAGAYMLSLDNYYSGAKAERELNIEYSSIDKAVADALDWFKTAKYY